jgi:hypothetical protein
MKTILRAYYTDEDGLTPTHRDLLDRMLADPAPHFAYLAIIDDLLERNREQRAAIASASLKYRESIEKQSALEESVRIALKDAADEGLRTYRGTDDEREWFNRLREAVGSDEEW